LPGGGACGTLLRRVGRATKGKVRAD
jgi:hypothetical protein